MYSSNSASPAPSMKLPSWLREGQLTRWRRQMARNRVFAAILLLHHFLVQWRNFADAQCLLHLCQFRVRKGIVEVIAEHLPGDFGHGGPRGKCSTVSISAGAEWSKRSFSKLRRFGVG